MKKNLSLAFLLLTGIYLPIQAQFRSTEWLAPNFWDNKTPYKTANIVFDHIENYYDSAFFSKGRARDDMSKTGYYPFLRRENFYKMHRNEIGQVPLNEQWNNFLKFRKNSLSVGNRNGNPVANWIPMGPNPVSTTLSSGYAGRMISFAYDPVDPNIVYSGAAEGGLWKSEDAGENWKPMTDQLPAVGVSSIAINPNDPNVLLIGTGEGKAYFTSSILSMKPGLGVFKSEDKGLTWTPTSFDYSAAEGVASYEMVWSSDDTNKVYLAASNGLWVSNDAGETWVSKLPHRMTSVVIKPDAPNTLFATAEMVGLFKSTDGGENWTLDNNLPTGNNFGVSVLAVCRDFPDFIVLSAADFNGFVLGLYKSSDGGNTWTNLNTPGCYLCSQNGVPLGWYVNTLAVSPADTNRIIIGGTPLYVTANGGQNWVGQSIDIVTQAGRPFIDQHKTVFSPHDDMTVFETNDGGIVKSTNGGSSWTLKNKGIATGQFYAIASSRSDPNLLTGGFQDHGLLKVEDYQDNLTWSKWWRSDGTRVLIDPDNPNIIYGQTVNGSKVKSNNGGLNAFPINSGLTGTFSSIWVDFMMDPVDSKVLFTANINRIFKSTNGGGSWQAKSTVAFAKALAISTIDNQHVYAAGWPWNSTTSNTFYHSTDNGETWAQTAAAPGWRAFHIEADPVDLGTVYAVSNAALPNQPHVLKSTDHGQSWTDMTNNLPDIGTNDIAINPYNNQHLYVATDFGMFASVNGGEEWFEFNDNNLPLVYCLDIHIHPTDTTLRVGTQGRSAWLTKAIPIDIMSSTATIQAEAKGFSTLQVSPNPSDDYFNISFDLEKKRQVQLSIYNALGQRLYVVLDETLSSGTHAYVWDGQNAHQLQVAPGVYYLQMSLDGMGKMVSLLKQ